MCVRIGPLGWDCTYMWERFFICRNILVWMSGISIPSRALNNTQHVAPLHDFSQFVCVVVVCACGALTETEDVSGGWSGWGECGGGDCGKYFCDKKQMTVKFRGSLLFQLENKSIPSCVPFFKFHLNPLKMHHIFTHFHTLHQMELYLCKFAYIYQSYSVCLDIYLGGFLINMTCFSHFPTIPDIFKNVI